MFEVLQNGCVRSTCEKTEAGALTVLVAAGPASAVGPRPTAGLGGIRKSGGLVNVGGVVRVGGVVLIVRGVVAYDLAFHLL